MIQTALAIASRPIERFTAPAKDPAYLRWIRTLPCSVSDCRGAFTEAAHTGSRGLGQKASDHNAIPLCPFHHRTGPHAYHQGRKAFESHYRLNIPAIIRELNEWWNAERSTAA